jgi:L,D-transpeptidase YcbB
MRSRSVPCALVLLWIIMLLGGGRAPSDAFAGRAKVATPPATAHQQLSPAGKASLQEYLDAAQLPDLQYPDFRNYRTEAKEFYEAAENALPWVPEGHPSPQARSIIKVLELADDEGLNPVDYDGPRWDARVATIDSGRATQSELVRFDLAVTISTMRYISDLHRGRVNPREFHFELDIENKNIDLSEFLRQRLVNAQDVQTTMRTVAPPFPGYHRTIDALKTYRTLASE